VLRRISSPATLRDWNASDGAAAAREGVEDDSIELDMKVRVGLGVNVGEIVYIDATPIKRKNSLTTKILSFFSLENIVGSQPELMRVDKASVEDGEIEICRIPPSVFDVLGIGEGDHVMLQSGPGKKRAIRAAELTEQQKKNRLEQRRRMPRFYAAPFYRNDIQRVEAVDEDAELPNINLDNDARQALGVSPGDVVRVVRHPRKNLGFRPFAIFVPSLFLAIEASSDVLEGFAIIMVGSWALATILGVELRQRIR